MSKAPTETAEYLNKWVEIPVSYNQRDLLLYAVGIGCTEPHFVFENSPDFAAFPTYPLVLSFKGTSEDVVSFPSPAMFAQPSIPLEGIRVGLDGERSIEKLAELNPEGVAEGDITIKMRLIGCHKRGSGASVENEMLIVEKKSGKELYRIISGAFLVGPKNFKDSGVTHSEKVVVPNRAPDKVEEMPTSPTQTHIYRLSGDYNPLHIDQDFATMSGFKEPILHGLCSFGITARACLKAYGGNDPKRFKSFKARFAKTVVPGDTLVVEMWKEGGKIICQTKSKNTGEVVINNAYMVLTPEAKM